jgi:hypothetical protein
MAGLLKRQVDG